MAAGESVGIHVQAKSAVHYERKWKEGLTFVQIFPHELVCLEKGVLLAARQKLRPELLTMYESRREVV